MLSAKRVSHLALTNRVSGLPRLPSYQGYPMYELVRDPDMQEDCQMKIIDNFIHTC